MCEISIIIPVYNGEKYLTACLESVCHSTIFEKCEVLLIDDGSVDGSPGIIKHYEQRYEGIHGYTFPNRGPGISRNRGIGLAKGRYLFFLDSDDMVEPDYLEQLYDEIVRRDCDLVCGGYSTWRQLDAGKVENCDRMLDKDHDFYSAKGQDVSGERTPVYRKVLDNSSRRSRYMDGCSWLEHRMDAGDWINQVWCALYNSQFLVDHHLEFCGNIYLYEDVLFTTEVLLCARTVGSVPAYGYLYRSHEQGLVNGGIRVKDVECCIGILELMRERYRRLEGSVNNSSRQLQAHAEADAVSVKGCLSTKKARSVSERQGRYRSSMTDELSVKRQLHALGRVAAEMVSMYLYFLEALHLSREEEQIWLKKLSDMRWRVPMLRSVSSGKELIKWGLCSFAPKLYYHLVNRGKNPVRQQLQQQEAGQQMVSVIIPCCNSASTLDSCLDSVCGQTFRNLEILVVDDGSVDDSWSVIQRYEQKDSRVRGIRQSHQGVSAARNLGLQSAGGRYIQFVDADDWIAPGFTAYMVHLQEKKPEALVVCDYVQYEATEKALQDPFPDAYAQDCHGAEKGELTAMSMGASGLEHCSELQLSEMEHFSMTRGYYTKKQWIAGLVKKPEAHYFGVLWNKLYRRELILKNGCLFPEKVSLGEDFIFNMQYLPAVTGVVCTDRKMYHYLWKRKGSLTACADEADQIMDARLQMYDAYRVFFEKEGLTGLWKFWLHYYMVLAFFRICDEYPTKEVQDRYYQSWIRDCGISGMEYEGYHILRKIKQLKNKWK